MHEGADGSGAQVRQKHGLPDNNEKRRKYFLSASNRESFTFEKGRLYQADFYNPYLDFGNFALKLPGFSLKVIKYVDQKSHCLRYVFKNRKTGDVYLNVNMHLLWGEKLQKALQQEREYGESGINAVVAGIPAQSNGGRQNKMNDDRQADAGAGFETPEAASAKQQSRQGSAQEPGCNEAQHSRSLDAEPEVPSALRQEPVQGPERDGVQQISSQSDEEVKVPPSLQSEPVQGPAVPDELPRLASPQSDGVVVGKSAEPRHLFGDHHIPAELGSGKPVVNEVMDGTPQADGGAADGITQLLKDTSTSDRRDDKYFEYLTSE